MYSRLCRLLLALSSLALLSAPASATEPEPPSKIWVGHAEGQPDQRVSLYLRGEQVVFVTPDAVLVGRARVKLRGPGTKDGELNLAGTLDVTQAFTLEGRPLIHETALRQVAVQLGDKSARLCASTPGAKIKLPVLSRRYAPPQDVRCWRLTELPAAPKR